MLYKICFLLAAFGDPATNCTSEIVIDDAQVKLISQVRVPARQAGVLAALDVAEGDRVKAGSLLGVIDDQLPRVELGLAKLDHQIAKIACENDIDKRYAQKSLDVARSEHQRSEMANEQYADSGWKLRWTSIRATFGLEELTKLPNLT